MSSHEPGMERERVIDLDPVGPNGKPKRVPKYHVFAHCGNCDWAGRVKVPKGVAVAIGEAVSTAAKCRHCGCFTLVRTRNKSEVPCTPRDIMQVEAQRRVGEMPATTAAWAEFVREMARQRQEAILPSRLGVPYPAVQPQPPWSPPVDPNVWSLPGVPLAPVTPHPAPVPWDAGWINGWPAPGSTLAGSSLGATVQNHPLVDSSAAPVPQSAMGLVASGAYELQSTGGPPERPPEVNTLRDALHFADRLGVPFKRD